METKSMKKIVGQNGKTFFATREDIGYTGSSCFGRFNQFTMKKGWVLYDEEGKYVTGRNSTSSVQYSTLKELLTGITKTIFGGSYEIVKQSKSKKIK